jgi:single-strand DNA-binding protein
MISATVAGNIGQDAEVREAGDTSVVNFSIASNGRSKVDGEWVETTTWVRVAFFGARAQAVSQYLVKGKTVAVRGELSMRTFETKKGETRTSLELRADDVKLLGGKVGGGEAPAPKAATGKAAPKKIAGKK